MRLIAFLSMLLAACTPSVADPGPGLRPIAVEATPIPLDMRDPGRAVVGRLRYMGGLELRSDDARFGGISGLRLSSPGRLVAITDGGQWVTLDLVEKAGRLVGMKGVSIGLIRGPLREPLKGKAYADAEALEIQGKRLTVAFEREHRVWHYREPGGSAESEAFPDTRWLEGLPANSGVEAMAKLGTAWLYLAEASDADGTSQGVLAVTGGLTRTFGRVRFELPAGFRPTDAQALDDDRVLLLGRRYAPLSGMAAVVAILPIDKAGLKAGPAQVIATIEPPLSVDNMEGLAVTHEGGRPFVYLISDDNFSPLQRTLLMKFELT